MKTSRLDELAGSVSDRKPVDWESAREEALGPGLEGLRALDRLAAAFEQSHKQNQEHEPPAEPLFRWGELEVEEKIGQGQFGEVFRAWDPVLGRSVALKLTKAANDHQTPRQNLDEARRLASVRHPNVMVVFGAASHDGRAGIWSELLEGHTLEERLERDGTLSAAEITLVGTELCQALAAVHGAGLVHGDIKTSNVLRAAGGRLVLVDFGAAHFWHEGTPAVIQGTPSYLPPEIASGDASPTPESDLYALGALLYRLASQEFWRGPQSTPLRESRPDLPPWLVQAIESMVAEEPKDRPTSAARVERLLLTPHAPSPRPHEDPSNARSTGKSLDGAGPPRTRPRLRRAVKLMLAAALPFALAMLLAIAIPGPWSSVREPSLPTEGRPDGGPQPHDSSTPRPQQIQTQLRAERGGAETPLRPEDRLHLGDRLSLQVTLTSEAHVYVLNEDQSGALFVLFPLPQIQPVNPLPAGDHRLPGHLNGQAQSWQVTSQGGWERFLIAASPIPVPRLEDLISELDPASPERGVSREPGGPSPEAETFRGVGGLVQSHEEEPEDSSRLEELATELRSDEIRTRLLVFENPR